MPLDFSSNQPLQDQQEDEDQGLPSYMVAANLHNYGNLNTTWDQPDEDQGNLLTRAGKFAAVSVASGLNSFYNTAQWAGNWFSDDGVQYRDTADWLKSFDDDLGTYYEKNRESADLVGFALTSFIPGLGGVKVLSAGAKILSLAKEGEIGYNMGRALGLAKGARAGYVEAAIADLNESNAGFSLINSNAVKAMAAGLGEQALQAAAFETAVTVTMKKSPVLDQLDLKDTLANIATGAILGGAIGGVIEGAITYSTIKKGITAFDAEVAPFRHIAEGVEGTSPSDRLLIHKNDLVTTPVPDEGNIGAQNLFKDKERSINNKARTAAGELANGDQAVADVLHGTTWNAGLSQEEYEARVLGLHSVERSFAPSAVPKDDKEFVQYLNLKTWGENAGRTFDGAPEVKTLSDTLKKGEELVTTRNTTKVGNEQYYNRPGDGVIDVASLTPLQAEARYIHAIESPGLETYVGSKGVPLEIGYKDYAYLEKAYHEGFTNYVLKLPDGGTTEGLSGRSLLNYIQDNKERDAFSMLQENTTKLEKRLKRTGEDVTPDELALNTATIAQKLNTKVAYLEGTSQAEDRTKDLFALKSYRDDFLERAASNGNVLNPDSVRPWATPQNLRLNYDTRVMGQLDNNQIDAMVGIKQRQNIQRLAQNNASASVLGVDYQQLPAFADRDLLTANRVGAGSGLFSFADANYYEPLKLKVMQAGQVVSRTIKKFQDETATRFEAVNYKLANNPQAVAEVAALDARVRATGLKYTMNTEGDGLILRSMKDYYAKVAAGEEAAIPIVPKGVQEEFKFLTPEAKEWVQMHLDTNGARVVGKNNLVASKGIQPKIDPSDYYPIPPNADRYKYIAFVRDPSISNTGHLSMIYAETPEKLAQLRSKVPSEFDVITKGDIEEYKLAIGEYKYSEGLNENYINTALARTGTGANFFPPTDPKIFLDDAMAWHANQDAMLVRDAVSTKYSSEFAELRDMGSRYTKDQTSTFKSFGQYAENSIKNPFASYVKTALGVSNAADYPLWQALNKGVDSAGSAVWGPVKDIWDTIKGSSTKDIEQLGMINNMFDRYGVQTAYQDAALATWSNHKAPSQVVSQFIRASNTVLSTLTLRMDPMNALNNVLGATVLRGAETASILRAINSSAEAAGQLKDLAKVVVPGTNDFVLSPTKLIGSAIADFVKDDGTLANKYKSLGWIKGSTDQFREMLDAAAIKGSENATDFAAKTNALVTAAKKLGDIGEKYTGNKLGEEMNRFVSARIMDKLTSVAVDNGLMDQATAYSYINTFVNRVEGNTLAAQRPMLFQGPVGQAIGLFQTYQFNIMQQLLRFVGEGQAKDAAMLLGLQGTIYGLNGLPAFSAVNNHIIGTASGNTRHTDAYSSINNVAGKDLGDWLTYGLASNFLLHPDLKLNLYTRGDINPRQVSVVPTNIADVPIVAGYAKFFGNLKDTVGKIQNGGSVWTSLLQGIEHNGVNRPLAGLAQVLEGTANPNSQSYSTSTKGNIVASNDLLSLANLSRLAGARPLDEAVALDAAFRVNAYKALDNNRKENLGEAIKTTMIQGNTPDQAQINNFALEYASIGGKQEEFNKYMMKQFKSANTSQANSLASKLNDPYAQYMQSIMGGRRFKVSPTDSPLIRGQEED